MKLKIAIVDDERFFTESFKTIIMSKLAAINLDADISGFVDLNEFKNSMIFNTYDLVFIDIDFKTAETGIDLINVSTKELNSAKIVYISNREDLVFDAMKTKPICFIRKKLFFDDFNQYFDEIVSSVSPKGHFLTLEYDRQIMRINIRELMYIECTGKHQWLYLSSSDNPIETIKTMKSFEDSLSEKNFIRIHSSYIVNLNFVSSFTNDFLTLANGQKLPIAKKRKEIVKKAFLNLKI